MSTTTNSHDEGTAETVVDAVDPIIGLTLDGRYRVTAQLGKGAMGAVYRAVQEPLNRTVALKVLDSNYGAGRDETFRQRFLVEAALTAKLSHPNTVRIFDYGCTKDGLFYLAMEHLSGETLDRVLHTQVALSWRRVAAIALQIARALREAHGLGVVHRDLKPANIMVLAADSDTDTDHVKVLDFGLVKSFIEGRELEGRVITQHGMLMGSPPYMAPEQGDKNRADPRSDIYSLGIVMFEAVSGRPPFTGNAALEIILKHVNQALPSLSVPAGFEAPSDAMTFVVKKCLAKSPMDRFQSMEELIAALQPLVTGPSPTPSGELPSLHDPDGDTDFNDVVQRDRTGVLVLGIFAALLVGIVGTTLFLRKSDPAPAQSRAVEESAQAPQKTAALENPQPAGAPKVVASTVVFHIVTTPAGATVRLNGKVVGVTPLEYAAPAEASGRAKIEALLSLNGFIPMLTGAEGEGRVEVVRTLPKQPPTSAVKNKRVIVSPKGPVKQPARRANKPAAKLDDDDDPTPSPSRASTNDLKRPSP